MMLSNPMPLILLALSAALAAPSGSYEEYPVVIPQKRAALVLDRLLVALQKALHDDAEKPIEGPRTAPLRIDDMNIDDMVVGAGAAERTRPSRTAAPLRIDSIEDDMRALQRRGQSAKGRVVLRCYFNAVTCF